MGDPIAGSSRVKKTGWLGSLLAQAMITASLCGLPAGTFFLLSHSPPLTPVGEHGRGGHFGQAETGAQVVPRGVNFPVFAAALSPLWRRKQQRGTLTVDLSHRCWCHRLSSSQDTFSLGGILGPGCPSEPQPKTLMSFLLHTVCLGGSASFVSKKFHTKF